MKNRLLKILTFLACGLFFVGATACDTIGEASSSSFSDTDPVFTEGVLYRLSEGGSYAEVYGYEGVEEDVLIADSYENKPVAIICESAFAGCNRLTSVTIPDSVISIGNWAFRGCNGLTNVTIGDAVTTIGNEAFCDCSLMTNVTFGVSVASIGSGAFQYCYDLTSLTIPYSVTSIGELAFNKCYKLVEVINRSPNLTIEKGSASNGGVGYYALEVYNIGAEFFEDNGYTIYKKNAQNILIKYTGQELNLILPTYVTKINQNAFFYFNNLTSVTVPATVSSIGNEAFKYCTSLLAIKFDGTTTQWNAIEKGDNWNDGVPATKVICKDGEVTLN